MPITDVTVQRHDANHVSLTITTDGRTLRKRIVIPDPLPDEIASKKAYVKQVAQRMVEQHTQREARQANREADREAFKTTGTNQAADAAAILTDLTT